MDPAEKIEQELLQFLKPIEKATARGDSEIQQFYRGAVVFLTGGTGFIGKQLLEKLFRTCEIKKVYLLIRSKKGKPIKERLQEMLKEPVFEPVRKKKPDFESRIVAVEGDVASLQLGISNDDWSTIVEEVNVIFHVAATIRFDENLRTAAIINVRGAREALALGRACKNLRAYIHVSTAFSHATQDCAGGVVKEQFYTTPMAPEDLLDLVETSSKEELDRITHSILNGWPNTYTFTKAVAEDLVRSAGGNFPICLFRPSIVIQAYHEPLPGWIDVSAVFGPTGSIIGAGVGVLRVVYIDNSVKLSLVPVDYVNNAMIAAGWSTGNRGLKEPLVYNVSSTRSGITFRHVTDPLRAKCRELVSPVAVWYCYLIETNNRLAYWFLSWVLHYIPAYIIDFAIKIFKIKKPKGLKSFVELYRKYDKLSAVLSFYNTHYWNFDDSNLQSLWRQLSGTDKTIFNFSVDSIDWEQMVIAGCIGGRRHIMKDGLKGTEAAVAKQKWLKLANYAVLAGYLAVAWMVLSWLWYLVVMMI